MAGHSKWANIQHRKGAQDKKRAGLFAKLAKEIYVAAKMGGGDIDSNPRLRLAVTTARGQSMPKDNIERAIKKGTGEGNEGANFEEIRYEGYGNDGIAVIVETMTDNRNRTASEIRSTFTKYGGNLGETGSVSFSFNQLGEITLDSSVADEETMLEAIMEAGATDMEQEGDVYIIYCEMTELHNVSTALNNKFGEIKSAKIIWQPTNTVELDLEQAKKVIKLVDVLECLDDVQSVYTNMDVSDEIAEQL
ncbi:MAG: YebC/PmpR family DNA-binding transcriptional regulator [Alphaproteobacteria bacterium]|nr:YebC/PmpR family DNA-binding transcriptional regulator [Alphaproteobacteria bacterium]